MGDNCFVREDGKVNIGLNVTRRCNMKCSFCFYNELQFVRKNEKQSIIPGIDLPLQSAIDKLEKYDISSIYLSGGEPFTYPHLKELLDWLIPRTEKILLCTNGILISPSWSEYIVENNITLLLSIKDTSKSTFRRFANLNHKGVNTHLYHVLNKDSVEILEKIPSECGWVEKIRLLIETHTNPIKNNIISAEEWFKLLKKARVYLSEAINKVEVEMGYVDPSCDLLQANERGAVNRIIIDVDLKVYSCPLLVEFGNGKVDGYFPRKCDGSECPVLVKETQESQSNFVQICPFVLTNLQTATDYIYFNEEKFLQDSLLQYKT